MLRSRATTAAPRPLPNDADLPNQWDALESHTAAPYTLTLKSNGCIIFIAALTPTKLLVTSKHSLGPTPGASGAESHAQVGERWLRKHLAAAGKTEEQLAQTLWEKNWTAVAEVRLPPKSSWSIKESNKQYAR